MVTTTPRNATSLGKSRWKVERGKKTRGGGQQAAEDDPAACPDGQSSQQHPGQYQE